MTGAFSFLYFSCQFGLSKWRRYRSVREALQDTWSVAPCVFWRTTAARPISGSPQAPRI